MRQVDVVMGALPRGLGLVERVVRGELDTRGGPGVVRLAEESGLDKGQASRLLRDLVGSGVLARDGHEFRAGTDLLAVAAQVGPWGAESRALLRGLVARFGACAYVDVLGGAMVLSVRAELAAWAEFAWARAGRQTPVWCTGAGRALLFDHSREAVAELLGGEDFIGAGGPYAPRTVDDLLARVAADAARGVAVCESEYDEDVLEVAAPVRDPRGDIVAAVSAVVPHAAVRDDRAELVAAVGDAASRLARLLG
ncbi:IclR family transcriptional regulator C-terminal domain-containing protein [Streptomyces sp. SID12488]|uniref:IclR family transcriptional regulator n=1 Tax=Streptomyces sp. SID12488 TaxID=2706040 RepID=UPI0013D9EB85|nr:IclR family transcriptional regulator C-terminal domain-containing protein [Streptomyces sp. SID12488]NEA66790.1 helix-turn-helix domain-containing protein [Streptomyces sp. SID12488]